MSKYGALGRTSALGQAEIVTKERDVLLSLLLVRYLQCKAHVPFLRDHVFSPTHFSVHAKTTRRTWCRSCLLFCSKHNDFPFNLFCSPKECQCACMCRSFVAPMSFTGIQPTKVNNRMATLEMCDAVLLFKETCGLSRVVGACLRKFIVWHQSYDVRHNQVLTGDCLGNLAQNETMCLPSSLY